MISNTFHTYYYLKLSLLLMLYMISCGRDKEPNKPVEFDWLDSEDNYVDSSFLDSCALTFQKYSKQQDWESAAYILEAEGHYYDVILQFDSAYVVTLENFIRDHSTQISEPRIFLLKSLLGSQFTIVGDYKHAEVLLNDAQKHISDSNAISVLSLFSTLTDLYNQSGDLEKSQEYCLQCLRICQRTNNKRLLSHFNILQAEIWQALGAEEKAIESLSNAVKYSYEAADTNYMILSHQSVALTLLNIYEDESLGEKYLQKAKSLLNAWSGYDLTADLSQIAPEIEVYIHKGEFDSARFSLDKLKSIIKEWNYEIAQIQYDDLLYLYKMKRYGIADQEIFNKGYKMAKENHDYYALSDYLRSMSTYLASIKQYKKAHRYLKEMIQYRDSLWDQDLKGKLYGLEKKYQSAKKEKQIAQQKKTITERNLLTGSLGMGFISSILIFVYFNNRRKRKNLEKEKQMQEEFTDQLLDNVEEERGRIAGELHDDVNHTILNIQNKLKQQQKIDLEELQSLMDKVRNISHDLFPTTFRQLGLIYSIQELCQRTTDATDIQIVHQLDYSHKRSIKEELQIYRIIQEALNNIIKHSEATHVLVKLESQSAGLTLSVRDNGKGFDTQKVQKKSSFGLNNIKQRAKLLNGKIRIKSNKDGTKIDLIVDSENG